MINETDYTNNPLTKEQENQIDALFAQYDTTNKPGCALGIIQDGRFIYKKSFGMANLEHNIPITSDSKFELASVSKQFTAACIALMHLDKSLNINDDVRKYIPELPDYGHVITISHLIYHTSGLRNYIDQIYFTNFHFKNYYSANDIIRLICRQKELNFEPGSRVSYSNSNYLLLTEIIARVSKKKFSEFINENLFIPLNMLNTVVQDNYEQIIINRADPYQQINGTDYIKPSLNFDHIGAKGVVTTINDMLLWDQNLYTGQVGGKEFTKMMTTRVPLTNSEENDYALGLFVYNYKNLELVEHTGGYFGFSTIHRRFPDYKMSIIILSNGDLDIFSPVHPITELLLKDVIIDPAGSKKKKKKTKSFKLSSQELEKFCANYWSKNDMLERKIYLKEGELYYWRNETSASKLAPISHNEFVMADSTADVRLNFIDEQNFITLNFIENGKVALVLKSYQPIIFSAKYLKKYIGKYFCEELDVTYQFKMESDKLVLFNKGKQISELKPVVPDVFNITELDFHISFNYNDKNEISGFIPDSDRSKNIKFVKKT